MTKPTSPDRAPLVAFGAHPDDLEFGCGGILAREAHHGRPMHLVVCSRGEAGTNGSPAERTREAEKAAKLLGATIEFVELDGDAHLEIRSAHALKLAAILRRLRPALVLSPTTEQNQHPDHWRLGTLVRDATRLARYGNVAGLRELTPHAIGGLFYYALGPGSEPSHPPPVLIDLSAPEIMQAWTAAMEAHASQLKTRNYVELQLARARVHGLNAGVAHAQPLWPNDPLVFGSLAPLTHASSKF